MKSIYKQIKKEAKKQYRKIKFVASPALNNERVVFTSVGFKHLVAKGNTIRPRGEQIHRFKLIKHATKIISDPNAVILYRSLKNERSYPARFWTFVSQVNSRRIKVVVRQVGDGSKHFFSIMGSRTKKSP